MRFEWDPEKATLNRSKHGVTLDEAATVFFDPLAATFADPEHSVDEFRFITIGWSTNRRLLLVSHTEEGDIIRTISARQATPRERKRHESTKEKP